MIHYFSKRSISLLLLFFLSFTFACQKPRFEDHEKKIIKQVLVDYEMLYNKKYSKDKSDLIYGIRDFKTDISYKNWDKAKIHPDLNKILLELEIAETDMDKLKEIINGQLKKFEKGENFSPSSQESAEEAKKIIEDMKKATDKASSIFFSN